MTQKIKEEEKIHLVHKNTPLSLSLSLIFRDRKKDDSLKSKIKSGGLE